MDPLDIFGNDFDFDTTTNEISVELNPFVAGISFEIILTPNKPQYCLSSIKSSAIDALFKALKRIYTNYYISRLVTDHEELPGVYIENSTVKTKLVIKPITDLKAMYNFKEVIINMDNEFTDNLTGKNLVFSVLKKIGGFGKLEKDQYTKIKEMSIIFDALSVLNFEDLPLFNNKDGNYLSLIDSVVNLYTNVLVDCLNKLIITKKEDKFKEAVAKAIIPYKYRRETILEEIKACLAKDFKYKF